MTQLEIARVGKVSSEMEQAAAAENVSSEKIRELIATGRAVLPKNKRHQFAQILAIGEGLRTKVNANIGTSGPCSGIEREIAKLDAAVAAGTDSVMDLSTGPDFQEVRQMVLERSPVMVGARTGLTLLGPCSARTLYCSEIESRPQTLLPIMTPQSMVLSAFMVRRASATA